ncbi:MAG: RdgB/HAM1 family non-canonical purine NTP pyrophosphatase [Legionella sp.]|nr:RdgB/HAM1 family non-canonical purine NTP pyrophosphatase [Legionella sp.]
MQQLILATSNCGKIKELTAILAPLHCIPQGEMNINSAEETGLSFIENALLKARHASRYAKLPALGDDSGLVVPALDGAPGIYSSRFAGLEATDADNNHLLLTRMAELYSNLRQAYFYCAIALVRHDKDPTPLIATGIFRGSIVKIPEGCGGFGYDSLFYCPQYQCTAAQLPAILKNQISHRAQALTQLRDLIHTL